MELFPLSKEEIQKLIQDRAAVENEGRRIISLSTKTERYDVFLQIDAEQTSAYCSNKGQHCH